MFNKLKKTLIKSMKKESAQTKAVKKMQKQGVQATSETGKTPWLDKGGVPLPGTPYGKQIPGISKPASKAYPIPSKLKKKKKWAVENV